MCLGNDTDMDGPTDQAGFREYTAHANGLPRPGRGTKERFDALLGRGIVPHVNAELLQGSIQRTGHKLPGGGLL